VEKVGDARPNMADFRQRFRRMRQGVEMEQQGNVRRVEASRPAVTASLEESSAESCGASAPSANLAAPTIASAGSSASDKDVIAIYRAVQDPLRSVSQYLRAKSLTDPEAYRINRFVTWLGIAQLPPATDNKTQLKPVPKDKVS